MIFSRTHVYVCRQKRGTQQSLFKSVRQVGWWKYMKDKSISHKESVSHTHIANWDAVAAPRTEAN